jgi:hypothetical protein
MLEQIAFILKALCLMLAAVFVLLIVSAQLNCSQIASIGHQCYGPAGDVWMIPFFFAPIGIPALIGSIVISIVSVRRYVAGGVDRSGMS